MDLPEAFMLAISADWDAAGEIAGMSSRDGEQKGLTDQGPRRGNHLELRPSKRACAASDCAGGDGSHDDDDGLQRRVVTAKPSDRRLRLWLSSSSGRRDICVSNAPVPSHE